MLKIVVFDGGWGGEVVASYLAKELKMVEVIRVIDWAHAPYEDKDLTTIKKLVCDGVAPYVGKADLIVLGGYVVSLVEDTLRRCYPGQKFVSMGINYYRILCTNRFPSTVTILGDAKLQDDISYMDVRKNLPYSTIIYPDCSGWENLIDLGEMTADVLRYELQDYFVLYSGPSVNLTSSPKATRRAQKINLTPAWRQRVVNFVTRDSSKLQPAPALSPETAESSDNTTSRATETQLLKTEIVLVLNTHYWEIEPEIKQIFGYHVNVLDFRRKLLHDVCLALGLLGVDGERSK